VFTQCDGVNCHLVPEAHMANSVVAIQLRRFHGCEVAPDAPLTGSTFVFD
jgi:hypothetical protein